MPKPLQTQWDFGKPAAPPAAPAAPARRVFTVAEVTGKVRQALETSVGAVWVAGEIGNLRVQSSGHAYFTLKDAFAQLACVLFKGDARAFSRIALQEGQKIILHGEITVYEPRGQYQLRVLAVELQGVGALQAAFEQLKQKLQNEGLFAPERKRPVPKYPQRIGIVTSPDGAALHDVLHVITRRQPGLEVFLAPCRVQGAGSTGEIAAALRLLNSWSEQAPDQRLDLILLTRGGGSLEDLWAFNEEIVARAIAASKLPVISAVGHEIDFTISDFTADLRAATPSAAAELITEGVFAGSQTAAAAVARMRQMIRQQFGWMSDELDLLGRNLEKRRPERILRDRLQRLDDFRETMDRCARAALRRAREEARAAASRLRRRSLLERLAGERQTLAELRRALALAAATRSKASRHALAAAEHRLRLLSPQHTLDRGYSITWVDESGQLLRDPAALPPATLLRTKLARGEIKSRTL